MNTHEQPSWIAKRISANLDHEYADKLATLAKHFAGSARGARGGITRALEFSIDAGIKEFEQITRNAQ